MKVERWVRYKGWLLGDYHDRDKIYPYPPKAPEKFLPPLGCPAD